MKPAKTLFTVIAFFYILPSSLAQHYKAISGLKNNKLGMYNYVISPSDSISVADLDIIEDFENQPSYGSLLNEPYNAREYLLSKGYAKFKDSTLANPSEMEAQRKAQAAEIGIWAKKISPVDTSKSNPVSAGSEQNQEKKEPFNWPEWLKYVIGFFGFSTFVAIVKYILDKRLKLLIIGEISSGKTALLTTLLDPAIKKNSILSLKKSDVIVRVRSDKTIQCGSYQIRPILTDVPGSQYDLLYEKIVGNIFDIVFRRKFAIVFMLSPVKHYGQQEEKFDRDYKNVQLGILKACLGAISSKKPWKKPKVFLLFISKFDLISKQPLHSAIPDSPDIKILEEYFDEHIKLAIDKLKKQNIPCKVIVGSAAENWNTREVLIEICNQLYL